MDKKDWYVQNKHLINKLLREQNFDEYSRIIASDQPDPQVRKKKIIDIYLELTLEILAL